MDICEPKGAPRNTWAPLVSRIQAGDQGAVETLYEELSGSAVRSLFWKADPDSAADRLHDLIVVVVGHIRAGNLRDPDCLMGFAWSIARRIAARQVAAVVTRRCRNPSAGQQHRAPGPSPEVAFGLRQEIDRTVSVLKGLKPRDREILTRFYLDEQTKDDIVREMGITETQFRLAKSRALATCRQKLSGGNRRNIHAESGALQRSRRS